MAAEGFYTELAEASKAGFYVALFAAIGIAYAGPASAGTTAGFPGCTG